MYDSEPFNLVKEIPPSKSSSQLSSSSSGGCNTKGTNGSRIFSSARAPPEVGFVRGAAKLEPPNLNADNEG